MKPCNELTFDSNGVIATSTLRERMCSGKFAACRHNER